MYHRQNSNRGANISLQKVNILWLRNIGNDAKSWCSQLKRWFFSDYYAGNILKNHQQLYWPYFVNSQF